MIIRKYHSNIGKIFIITLNSASLQQNTQTSIIRLIFESITVDISMTVYLFSIKINKHIQLFVKARKSIIMYLFYKISETIVGCYFYDLIQFIGRVLAINFNEFYTVTRLNSFGCRMSGEYFGHQK